MFYHQTRAGTPVSHRAHVAKLVATAEVFFENCLKLWFSLLQIRPQLRSMVWGCCTPSTDSLGRRRIGEIWSRYLPCAKRTLTVFWSRQWSSRGRRRERCTLWRWKMVETLRASLTRLGIGYGKNLADKGTKSTLNCKTWTYHECCLFDAWERRQRHWQILMKSL